MDGTSRRHSVNFQNITLSQKLKQTKHTCFGRKAKYYTSYLICVFAFFESFLISYGHINFWHFYICMWAVGMATCYGLHGPGIESRWGEDFPHLSRSAVGPIQPPIQWLRVFPGVKRPGRGVDFPPTSSAKVKERVELYLYSTFGPSWPLLGWTFLYLCVLNWFIDSRSMLYLLLCVTTWSISLMTTTSWNMLKIVHRLLQVYP